MATLVVHELLKTAEDIGLEADGSDGAYSNVKYHAYREVLPTEAEQQADLKRTARLCGNHGTHITTAVTEGILWAHVSVPMPAPELKTFLIALKRGFQVAATYHRIWVTGTGGGGAGGCTVFSLLEKSIFRAKVCFRFRIITCAATSIIGAWLRGSQGWV